MSKSVSKINEELFNQISKNEEWYFSTQFPRLKILFKVFKELKNKEIVADVGCFTGIIAKEYFKLGAKIVEGFDVSGEALFIASKRLSKVYKWRAGEESAPVESNRYDAIIATEVIEHIFNTDYFIEELKRILKPNGRIIITTPNLHSAINRALFLFGKYPWTHPGISTKYYKDKRIDIKHIRIGNLSKWINFFDRHGLYIEKVVGINYSLKSKIISLGIKSLSHNKLFVLTKHYNNEL